MLGNDNLNFKRFRMVVLTLDFEANFLLISTNYVKLLKIDIALEI